MSRWKQPPVQAHVSLEKTDIDAHKDESDLHGAGCGLQRRLRRDAATPDKGAGGTGRRLLGTSGTRDGFLLGVGSGRLPDTLRGALWRPRRHVVTDDDDHQPRDFVELLDQPDGGRRIRDNDMEQVGVYVLAALLLPLLRRAPHRVELDVPFRRAWMTAARRLGQRRLSSRSTRCGGRLRQCAERRRLRQRRRPATVPHCYRRERGGAGTTETHVRLLTAEWRERTARRRMVVRLRVEIARLEAAHPARPRLGEARREVL